MPKFYGNGLTSVAFAPIAVDGGPGNVFTELGSTERGSMRWTSADGTSQDFFIEEIDEAILSLIEKGAMQVTWRCNDIGPQTMALLMGGDIEGDGTNGNEWQWLPPVGGVQAAEKTLRIINKQGITMTICRVSLSCTFDMALSKGEISGVNVTCTILAPTKVNERPWKWKYPSAS